MKFTDFSHKGVKCTTTSVYWHTYMYHSLSQFLSLSSLIFFSFINCIFSLCPTFSLFCIWIPGGQSHIPLADLQEDDDDTDVSLITGALRSNNLMSREPSESPYGSSVVLRNQTMTVATNPAGKRQSVRSDAAFKTLFIVHTHIYINSHILQVSASCINT